MFLKLTFCFGHKTFERYKALRAGRKPAPFRKKGGQAQEAQGEGGSYVKAGFAPTFDDFGKGGAKSKQEDFSAFSKVEGTGSKKGARYIFFLRAC